jgi:Holliday junction resolvasome RuvABC endonuclease subunit
MIIGIDPGAVSAAYGVLDDNGSYMACGDIPIVDRMVEPHGWGDILRTYDPSEVVIEAVNAFPGQGVSSCFRFGMGTGIIRGVAQGLGFPLTEVTPAKWKKHFNLDRDGEKSRALALRTWPTAAKHLTHKKDHGRAEALLLAKWRLETFK